jgi:molecular chaperone DnaK
VTFDLDANGILNVSARDKDTGAEQKVTITETTNLDSSDIERMIKEAEEHAAEDRQRREEVDARNELDAFAHRVERQLEELGDRVPVNQKEQAGALVRDARAAIEEQAGLDRVRPLISDLQQMVQALQSAGATAGPGDGGGDGEGQPAAEEEEEVVDAEFTRE